MSSIYLAGKEKKDPGWTEKRVNDTLLAPLYIPNLKAQSLQKRYLIDEIGLSSLYVVVTFPLDFGPTRWSNPAVWADHPRAVPPAWTDVWFSPEPRGHIQATEIGAANAADAEKFLAENAARDGVDVTLEVHPEMIHGFQGLAICFPVNRNRRTEPYPAGTIFPSEVEQGCLEGDDQF